MSWVARTENVRQRRFGWPDVFLLLFVLAILAALLSVSHGEVAPRPDVLAPVNLAPSALPGDALRSLARIFIAFGFSLLFAIAYGYAAARSIFLRRLFIPLLDILQSVPVLGFLAASVTFLVALTRGSVLGFEIAAVFAIFTAQAWNMTFAVYHSLVMVPRDLDEASDLMRLSPWAKLTHLELPTAAIPLVLNSMLSFGASWFFLYASESFDYAGHTVRLPGIGSYIFAAQEAGDTRAMLLALGTMVVLIIVVDQLFWRPAIAWAHKFKLEHSPSPDPSSFVLTVLRRSVLVGAFEEHLAIPVLTWVDRVMARRRPGKGTGGSAMRLAWVVFALVLVAASVAIARGAQPLVARGVTLLPHALLLGLATLGRVLASVVLGAAWTVPVGVAIGLSPKATRWGEPISQIAASFPANIAFPFALALFLDMGLSLNIGAIPLMMLGTQWYILFNVMAGTIAIPADMKEAARVFGLRGVAFWRNLILPAIFPSLVTGGITAAGGAWNASIVAEFVTWAHHTVAAQGLGAMIAEASATGDGAAILTGVVVMSVLVVAMNRFVWRPLYALAESRFHVEA